MPEIIQEDPIVKEGSVLEEVEKGLFGFLPHMDSPQKVPTHDAHELSQKEFEDHWVSENQPCLIRGAVKHWPAVTKWKDKDYWLSHCDNPEVGIYLHQNFLNADRQDKDHYDIPFHEAITRLYGRDDKIFSIPASTVSEDNLFKEVLKDVGDFPFLKNAPLPRAYPRRRLFLHRCAATNWHYHDLDETLMCQVKGKKRVALLAPKIAKPGYVSRFLEQEDYFDGKTLDPALDLKPYFVEVNEGDALYIPPYWYHAVVPGDTEEGFTLAFCWKSPVHILGDLSNFFVRLNYKRAFWPISRYTLLAPIILFISGVSLVLRKLLRHQRLKK